MQDMVKVPVAYIFAAIVPAVMIAGLYFFDHSVASQMAQQKEFNLQKPSAYHYDMLLLGIMVCYMVLNFLIFCSTNLQVWPTVIWIIFMLSRHSFVVFLGFLLQMEYFLSHQCILKVWQFWTGRQESCFGYRLSIFSTCIQFYDFLLTNNPMCSWYERRWYRALKNVSNIKGAPLSYMERCRQCS